MNIWWNSIQFYDFRVMLNSVDLKEIFQQMLADVPLILLYKLNLI